MDGFDIDELISQLTGISIGTVEAVRLGATGAVTALAENRSMTYEQFAEVWHQERMAIAQAQVDRALARVESLRASGATARQIELAERVASNASDIATALRAPNASEAGALLGAKFAGAASGALGVAATAYDAHVAYQQYLDGNYDGAAGTMLSSLGGLVVGSLMIAAAASFGLPAMLFFGALGTVAGALGFKAIFPGWDSVFDYWTNVYHNVFDHISDDVNADYNAARRWVQRRDPLVIDLDGDGIETVGVDGAVLFDHNGDGVKTGTGWVQADDGFLVFDRNGNGLIDTGGELFGVDTVKSDGSHARDGFDALRDLDSNGDLVFDANDAAFGNVRIWQDLDQDGVTDAGELRSLSAQVPQFASSFRAERCGGLCVINGLCACKAPILGTHVVTRFGA